MATKKTGSKTSTKKRKVTKQITEPAEVLCSRCGTKNKVNFYKSSNSVHQYNEKFHICKQCMQAELDLILSKYEDNKFAFYIFCRKFDIVFGDSQFNAAINQNAANGTPFLGGYMKYINSLGDANNVGVTFCDTSEFLDRIVYNADTEDTQKELQELRAIKDEYEKHKAQLTENGMSNKTKLVPDEQIIRELDQQQSKKDVINILGYDPFINEPVVERPALYASLIDYLDENTQNDNFKIPICIQIVKSFNQANRIDKALAVMDATTDAADIKKLFDTKGKIIKSTLDMAKDNGISVNHSNNKSKGAGTLSGIVKDLKEKGIKEIEVNCFDIETCEGMKKVADVSNRSILDQLMFDENDYTDMIKEQREMILDYKEKANKFEELLRLEMIKTEDLKAKLEEQSEETTNEELQEK
jgi:hypothetical protein